MPKEGLLSGERAWRISRWTCLLLFASLSLAQAQPATNILGTTSIVVGPPAGTNSVVLGAPGAWTAVPNASWLHVSIPFQSGSGSTNVIFSYDANSGGVRAGTLTIAGITLTVTQAGSTFSLTLPPSTQVAPTFLSTLIRPTPLIGTYSPATYTNGVILPTAIAVDEVGNVYVNDSPSGLKEWIASNNTITNLYSGLGLSATQIKGLAVDQAGNVYVSEWGTRSIVKWSAVNGTLTNLVSSGLNAPWSVAVDRTGNVYIADGSTIKEWTVSNGVLATVVSSGLTNVQSLAVDAAGNIYMGDEPEVKEWIASSSTLLTLVSNGYFGGAGSGMYSVLAMDGCGNVYFVSNSPTSQVIEKWTPADNVATTLASPLGFEPSAIAVDATGNIYAADVSSHSVYELPVAFVDSAPKEESLSSGTDVVTVLPASENLLPPFSPTIDQAWLTTTGITNGVLGVSFTGAPNSRTAHIAILGLIASVIQGEAALGTYNLIEGPGAGSDSVVLSIPPSAGSWTATANASWLHLSQTSVGSTNVIFSYDTNPGGTRNGTLTVAGMSLAVTQAGATYVPAQPIAACAATPTCLAVDSMGNIYFSSGYSIGKWTIADNTVTSLVKVFLTGTAGMATDSAGDTYFLNPNSQYLLEEIPAGTTNVLALASGLSPANFGVAVDAFDNVIFADRSTVQQWNSANGTVAARISSGLVAPEQLTMDIAGNLYVYELASNLVEEWAPFATNAISLGLTGHEQMAVDGSGKMYMNESYSGGVIQWTPASNSLTTLTSPGGSGVTVDGAGNVYFGCSNMIIEIPRAFVDSTPNYYSANAGSDALAVVPSTVNLLPPFTPTSDQPWLTVTGANAGIVTFAFAGNATGFTRTGHITVLGQSVPVTQYPVSPVINPMILPSGMFQFALTNLTQTNGITIITSTNLLLPLKNWTVLGSPTIVGSNFFTFTDTNLATNCQRFYSIVVP